MRIVITLLMIVVIIVLVVIGIHYKGSMAAYYCNKKSIHKLDCPKNTACINAVQNYQDYSECLNKFGFSTEQYP